MEAPMQQRTPSPRKAKLFRCAYVSCPGLGIASDKECFMCGTYLHSFCVAETVREIEGTNAMPWLWMSNLFALCPAIISLWLIGWHLILLQANKEQLKKEAREGNVKVNCQVNGVSHDASKEVITACLLKKNSTATSCISHFITYGRGSNCQ